MNFSLFITIFILLLISVGWAFLSLRQLKKHKHVEPVKKNLEKGRVIFYHSSSRSEK